MWHGLDICREIHVPQLAQLANLFHMMTGGDKPEILATEDAVRFLRHVYVADFESRQFPGFDPGETARLHPYFHALEALRRAGGIPKDLGISCECGWNGEETIETKLENALKTMKDMLR